MREWPIKHFIAEKAYRFNNAFYSLMQKQKDVEALLLEHINRRIFVATSIFLPVFSIQAILFWSADLNMASEMYWRRNILWAYAAIISFLLLILIVSIYIGKGKSKAVYSKALIYGSFLFVITSSVVIVTIDQIVTPSITPFLFGCTIAAVLFIIPPHIALIFYIYGFVLMYKTIETTQMNSAALLSNRVNGFATVGLAVVLSVILWQKTVEGIHLERHIIAQKDELDERNKKLSYLSSYDSLTGLLNRRQMEVSSQQQIEKLKELKLSAALLLIDVDYFKTINDRYGHPAGDKVLSQLGELLAKHVRREDLVSRWGGEEFLCFLNGATIDEAGRVAEELCRVVQEHSFEIEGHQITCTISIGFASVLAEGSNPLIDAYHQADKALYRAKGSGRNQAVSGHCHTLN